MNPTKDTPAGANARFIGGGADIFTLVKQDGSGYACWRSDIDGIEQFIPDRHLELLEPVPEPVDDDFSRGYRAGFKAARKAMKKALREVKP